ncbi:MAG TPA: glycosyltransferase [Streptosporangiaceae bacterium]|nr:glycosyltransferase [Streptosporangiaceae bacterium]
MRTDPAATTGAVSLEPGRSGSRAAGQGTTSGRNVLVTLNNAQLSRPPSVTVIVPTRNTEEGLRQVLDQLCPVIAPLGAEIIFVVDGHNGSFDSLVTSALTCPMPVRAVCRRRGPRRGDRSSAIIEGARHARGAWVLVLNAGLQHPPEAAAVLARTAMRHDADIVVGTRYADTKSPQDWPGWRGRLLAAAATRLTKSVFPRRLAMVGDPLSGMFAFRTAAVDPDRLNPSAFRLLLEILVRHPSARVAEVAYPVCPHRAGSRGVLRTGLRFLLHVLRLRLSRLAGQLRERPPTEAGRIGQSLRFLAFGLVGLSGLAVNTAALWFFYHNLGWNHLVGASLATQASTTWNFVLVDSVIYRGRAHGTRLRRAVSFFAMNNLLLLARLPVLQLLVVWGTDVLTANAITLILLFLVRFVVSDRAIFGATGQDRSRDPVRILVDARAGEGAGPARHAASVTSRKRSRYLPYRYDIAGVATVGSQITLPELEFFRAQWVPDREVDISVRVGDVGGRTPRKRAAMTEYTDPAAIRYEEHLGRLGANFRVYLDDPISVEVGPLLARSSHVVYTNIIEPLLRFVMVSRDRMLLHSACVELNGTGVMLSALTDTGKTGTVLRLLREHGGRFLSDDMTVIDAYGNASCFPKPLTISAHTLRAVRANDLTRSEWRRLQFQSRLHSKGGRSLGIALARFNLPIMGINALTQIMVPPPKYTVDRLVPCRMASSARVSEMFIIERGQPRLATLDHESALNQLIVNTDDAYGFPPFRYLAPAISIGGQSYLQLRRTEREILASFLSHLRIRTLASDSFSWADDIPRLIGPQSRPGFDVWDTTSTRQHPHPDAWPRWDDGLAYGNAG